MLKRIALRWDCWMRGTFGRMASSVGLLVLRIGAGLLLMSLHGWSKLKGFGEMSGGFPDPLGIGPTASLTLVVFAEFFCSILVVLGLFTRLTVIPPIIAMAVAAFVFHADDPWAKKELALLYLAPFVTLLLCGGGKLSLDGLIWRGAASTPKPTTSGPC
jgi:putative oxidoreductase